MQEATMIQPYFDTFKYMKLLSEHHFSDTQVQGLMSAEIYVLQSTLARMVTQEDLRYSEYALRADLIETEHKLRAEISEVQHKLVAKINSVEQRLEAKIDGVEQRLEAKIDGVEQRLEAKIDGVEQRLEAKITTAVSEMRAFTLKNTLWTILAILSLNIDFAALLALFKGF